MMPPPAPRSTAPPDAPVPAPLLAALDAADAAATRLGALESHHAEALVRVIEGAPHVRRRYHFFIWTQGPLQSLLPHQMAICGAYQRSTRELAFDAFNNVAVAPAVLQVLCEPRGLLQQAAQAAWVAGQGRALHFDVATAALPLDADARRALLDGGYQHWLVHGVSRPQRASEIESFFLLGGAERVPHYSEFGYADLLLPYLHSAYLRVHALERELGAAAVPRERPNKVVAAGVTVREKQILRWVRDGKNNQQIGEVLDISPLTVKNHIQKILRKLGAANRAQAVARAMALNLLPINAADRD